MTSGFNSFDASPFGAFVRSVMGARNGQAEPVSIDLYGANTITIDVSGRVGRYFIDGVSSSTETLLFNYGGYIPSFIFVDGGQYLGFGNGTSGCTVQRYSTLGSSLWARTISNMSAENVCFVLGDRVAVAGTNTSTGFGRLVCLDADDGTVVFDKNLFTNYGLANAGLGRTFPADSGYLYWRTNGGGFGGTEYMLRVNATTGAKVWHKTANPLGLNTPNLYYARCTDGRGYVYCERKNANPGYCDVFDTSGALLRSLALGASNITHGFGMDANADGDLVACTASTPSGGDPHWRLFAPDGTVLHTQDYTGGEVLAGGCAISDDRVAVVVSDSGDWFNGIAEIRDFDGDLIGSTSQIFVGDYATPSFGLKPYS